MKLINSFYMNIHDTPSEIISNIEHLFSVDIEPRWRDIIAQFPRVESEIAYNVEGIKWVVFKNERWILLPSGMQEVTFLDQ